MEKKTKVKCKHKNLAFDQENCAYCGRATNFCLDCDAEIDDEGNIISE